jgi:hypothetical protein
MPILTFTIVVAVIMWVFCDWLFCKPTNTLELYVESGLFRRRITALHHSGQKKIKLWVYYCDECLCCLAQGPTAPGSMNLVCNRCKINFGCLPNAYVEYEDALPPIEYLFITDRDIETALGRDVAFEHSIRRITNV